MLSGRCDVKITESTLMRLCREKPLCEGHLGANGQWQRHMPELAKKHAQMSPLYPPHGRRRLWAQQSAQALIGAGLIA